MGPRGIHPSATGSLHCHFCFGFFFLRLYLFIFKDRGREGESGSKTSKCGCLSHTPRTGDLACNPGMCPDWESNQRPFGSQAPLSIH